MFIISLALIIFTAGQGNAVIKLPEPKFTDQSIEECMKNRRSVRNFKNQALSLSELSNILWAAQGITKEETGFRTATSAGATYPLYIYYATEQGLFVYLPQDHAIKKIKDKDIRKKIAHVAFDQMFIADAGMVIVITAIFENTTTRYGERGVRYVYNEVGHCAQNIHLEAVALGLGSVPVGAYQDNELKELLALDKEEPLYIIPVGKILGTKN
jgi:SagB-type dehydrogenase family enzyme